MKLYLVRHGEAVPDYIDPQRPLSPSGQREIERIAEHLRNQGVSVDEFYHSSKLRAKQTAEIIQQGINTSAVLIEKNYLSPNDEPDRILEDLDDRETNLCIVSHLPFLPILMGELLKSKESYSFSTGATCLLERDSSGTWNISWAISPVEV